MFSLKQLQSALDVVQDELIQHHFWDEKLFKVEVYWVLYGNAYGWQYYGSSGDINIPAFSLSKLQEIFYGGTYWSLKDILRHEYAHAFAHTHKGQMKSASFKLAFGTHHDDEKTSWKFDKRFFVSEYAATNASEDFAETFKFYLNYSGILPLKFRTRAIRTKWNFIKELSKTNRKRIKH